MTKPRTITFAILSCLMVLCASSAAFSQGQGYDISSGGQPTITGALSGSVSGTSDVTQNLTVTINFGEVSPANKNSIVKVIVPVAIRSSQPYQVTVTIAGAFNANPRAIQSSDIGFGGNNMRQLGSKAQTCTRSNHIFYTPFNNDPTTTVSINASGRATYQSSLSSISGSTVILSGPKLTKGGGSGRRDDDGWVFDVILAITPQFYAPGTASATLTFTIGAGPNVQC
ncbi:MAG: hypothetical protein WCB68_24300 [Pyrinomonadaceae bacterium]